MKDLPIYVTRVDLELETLGPAHVDEITRELNTARHELVLR